MKKTTLSLFALLFICQISYAIDFYKGTYQQALVKGKVENKPLFLYFTAKWCGPCQYMQQYIFPDTTLSTYLKQHYIALKLDIDTEEGKLVYYKSHQPKAPAGVPAFIIMNSNEDILKKDVGGMKIAQLQQFLFKNEEQKVIYKALADSLAELQIKADSKKPTTISKLFYTSMVSSWKPGLKIGASLMGLKSALNSHQGMGYELGLFFDRSFKFKGEKMGFWNISRYHFQPGVSYSLQGGISNLHYLTLELFNGYRIKKLRGIELMVSPYMARGFGKNLIIDANRLDYGLKTGVAKQYGTFQVNLGYQLGLSDLGKLEGLNVPNRGISLSFAMIVGK